MAINNTDDNIDSLWTVEDLMVFAKVSRSWVYQRASSGALPSLKIGGLLRFDPRAVKSYLLSGTTAGRTVIPLINPKTPREGR